MIEWLLQRILCAPVSQSFLDLALAVLVAVSAPGVHQITSDSHGSEARWNQEEVSVALYAVADVLPAYVEALVRGLDDPADLDRPDDVLPLIPSADRLDGVEGAVVIAKALVREVDRSFEVRVRIYCCA